MCPSIIKRNEITGTRRGIQDVQCKNNDTWNMRYKNIERKSVEYEI